MTSGIYGIYNVDTLLYIGRSKDIKRRVSEHKRYINNEEKYRKSQVPLYYRIREIGVENISFETIEETTVNDMFKREEELIAEFKPLYNTVKYKTDRPEECVIYGIFVNDTIVYIGSSKSFEKRKKEHFKNIKSTKSKDSNMLIYQYLRTVEDTIRIEIIEYCENMETMIKREEELIWEHRETIKNVKGARDIKGRIKQYAEDNRDKRLENNKKYYDENREKLLEDKKRYWEENKETIGKKNKERYEKNKDKYNATSRKRREENIEYYREKDRQRRQRRRDKILEKYWFDNFKYGKLFEKLFGKEY